MVCVYYSTWCYIMAWDSSMVMYSAIVLFTFTLVWLYFCMNIAQFMYPLICWWKTSISLIPHTAQLRPMLLPMFTLGRFVSVLANKSMTAKSFTSNSRSYVTMKLLSCSVEQLFLLPKEIVVFKKSYYSEANMAETKQVDTLINSPKQHQPSSNPHQETNMLVTL